MSEIYQVKYRLNAQSSEIVQATHEVLFLINSKGSFICTIPDRIAHTTAFVTPVVEHWLEQEIAQWVQPLKARSDDPLHHERTLLPQSYISLPIFK